MLDQVSYGQGWHLRGTPLWIDAAGAERMCLVTGWISGPPIKHGKAVAPPALTEIWKKICACPSLLPLPGGRVIGVAGERVRLIAAHHGERPKRCVRAALVHQETSR